MIYKVLFILLTFTFSSIVVHRVLSSRRKLTHLESIEEWIYSMGIGPIIISLILYYSLLIFPHQPGYFYMLIPAIFLGVSQLIANYYPNLDDTQLNLRQRDSFFNFLTLPDAITIFLLSLFTLLSLYFILKNPILGHDVLEYGTIGKYYAQEKIIEYRKNLFFPQTGFYYVALHAPGFPLFATWEVLFNEFAELKGDFYFRSITFYYGLLILLLSWVYIRNFSAKFATFALLLILLNAGFMSIIFNYHLDSTRIFFHLAAFGVLFRLLKDWNISNLVLFSIICGALSFIHSMGFISAGILALIAFISANLNISKRIVSGLLMALIIIIAGSFHYFLDIFIGTGWIFNEQLKFF